MPKKNNFIPYFFVFLCLSLLLLFSSKISFLKPINSFAQSLFAPVQSLTYGIFSAATQIGANSKIKLLEEEKISLIKKLADKEKVEADNKALRDQFQTLSPRSANLVPAQIVGAPGFLPGVWAVQTLIINRGENDGVKVGYAVVYKDNLIGKVIKTTNFLSSVSLITNSSSSFTAKTLETNTLGVVKGQGANELIFDNVLLSETLKKDDLILTKGDLNQKQEGFPPGLIVGKIVSVSKKASDLFQKAEIKTLVDLTKLSTVFIIVNP